jgi:hypothetical protein
MLGDCRACVLSPVRLKWQCLKHVCAAAGRGNPLPYLLTPPLHHDASTAATTRFCVCILEFRDDYRSAGLRNRVHPRIIFTEGPSYGTCNLETLNQRHHGAESGYQRYQGLAIHCDIDCVRSHQHNRPVSLSRSALHPSVMVKRLSGHFQCLSHHLFTA